MSLIDFPTSPTVGQTYSFGTKTWTWNGTGWIASGGGPTGPTGPNGTAGTGGATGPTGPVTLFSTGITNGKITESHASSAVTFALKDLAGNDPSGGSPVLLSFPDGTTLTVTSALSITVASTKTLGAPLNNLPFRIWVAIASSSGAAVLVVRNCTVPWQSTTLNASVIGFSPTGLISSTATPGNVVQTNYTPAGTTLASAPYIIVAYADYDSGLATVGTWNVSPTRITQFSAGMPLPGDLIQEYVYTQNGAVSTTSTTFASMWSFNFAPYGTCNLTKLHLLSDADMVGDTVACVVAIFRGALVTQLTMSNDVAYLDSTGKVVMTQGGQCAMDFSGVGGLATQAYVISAKTNGSGTVSFPIATGVCFVSEIMG